MTRCAPLIPAEITAGLDFQVAVCLRDYPSTLWAMTLIARGPSSINLAATPLASAFQLSADASVTATWTPGAYWYVLRVSQGSNAFDAGRGQFDVLQDLATVSGTYDGRTQNEIALENLDAVIGKRATTDQQRYKINERELWRMTIADLLKLRSYYATQVRRERARNNGCSTFGRPVVVRFNSQ